MQHKDLREDWFKHSLDYQMGNIGSEVSRAIKNRGKPARFQGASERALELFDLTIEWAVMNGKKGVLREVCRAREEFCDYFYGEEFKTDAVRMQRYYDQFAMRQRDREASNL